MMYDSFTKIALVLEVVLPLISKVEHAWLFSTVFSLNTIRKKYKPKNVKVFPALVAP